MKVHMTAVTTKLGPYNRFVIWVQGCDLACPGCIAYKTHDFNKGIEITVEQLIKMILSNDNIEGITISGGEPTYKAKELIEIIERVKQIRDLGIIMYTGYTLEELQQKNNQEVIKLISLCDLVIDGRYIAELDNNLGLRGSTNQNVNQITTRYKNFVETVYKETARQIEIQYNEKEIKIIGLPDKRSVNIFKKWEVR
jgi:anaerobic ribonucleoside-triphosphate reductase activating protein